MNMFTLVEQADALLRSQGFAYAFCGGWAIDLYLGKVTRQHHDIDILAFWPERDAIILYMQSLNYEVYEMLGDGKAHHITDIHHQRRIKRNIFCCKQDCTLVSLSSTDESDVFRVAFHPIGQTKLDFLEFLFNDKTQDDFLYARNHAVTRSLDKAIGSANGVNYLAPEICLLYKSTDISRGGYQHDYDHCIRKMSPERKQWLNAALAIQYPQGHPWRT